MNYVQLPSGTVLETANPEMWPEAKRLTAKAGKAALFEESAAKMRELLAPSGTNRKTVHTIVTHVARSGMSRSIRCFFCDQDGPWDITGHVARLIDARIDEKNGGLKMTGCGMDMGFETVYRLGGALWPKGTPEPYGTTDGHPESSGCYAINHRWL